MALDPCSVTGDEMLDEQFRRIAGMPPNEWPSMLAELAQNTGRTLQGLETLFRLSLEVRRERDEEFACLKLRSYAEKHRPDLGGQDDGKGGLVIACPCGTGSQVAIRDASLLNSKPIVERLQGEDYTPSIAEYVAAIIGDDKARAMSFAIDDAEIELLAQNLEAPNRVKAFSIPDLRSINRPAMQRAGNQALDTVLELNARYAKVDQAGKIVIFDLHTLQSYLPREFTQKLSGQRVRTEWKDNNGKLKVKTVPKSKLWLEHPAHLHYEDVGFYPNDKDGHGRLIDTDGRRILNLWRGFAVEPKQGNWTLLDQHLRAIVCGGNVEHYQYVRRWLAHMLQKPWEKPGVAIVVKGQKRTGKGTMADMVREALGGHLARMYTHQDHVTGKFAGESTPKLFKQIEEAVFAKDGRVQGPLKSKITDQTETIEKKFETPVEIESFTRYWFNSNETAPVPATWDEERYLILTISPARRKDHAYFAAIRKQMLEDGGLQAMVHDLLTEDLTTFNVRRVPYSTAKGEVVREMLDRDMKGVLDLLVQGEIPAARMGSISHEPVKMNPSASTYVDKEHLYAVLEPHCREHGSSRSVMTSVGMLLHRHEIVSDTIPARRSLTGKPQFVVRPLNELRSEFSEKYGIEFRKTDDTDAEAEKIAEARSKLAELKQALVNDPEIANLFHIVEMAEAAMKQRREAAQGA